MNNASSVMESAYTLIENGETKKAQTLLQTLLPEQERNPDFWWLMAHATDDPKQGKAALYKVQDLEPNYEGLSALLEKTSSQDEKKSSSALRRIIPLLLVLVVAIAIFFFVLINQPLPATTPTTAQATATIQALIANPTTDANPLSFEAQSASFGALYTALASFDVPADGIQTPTANTLNIPVCSSVGVGGGSVVRDILVTLANNLTAVPQDIEQVEVSIQNCTDTGETLRTLSVAYSVLQNYQEGTLSLQELQQAIQPVR